jgi:tetratricopeptide (TPR) repeat protein
MSDPAPRHPGAEVMAAFVDGTLAPTEIPAVAGHLQECADCRTVVTETARFSREEAGSDPIPFAPRAKKKGLTPLWAAAAAVVFALTGTLLLRRTAPVAQLIAAAPREHRLVDGRLAGFPWARLQAPSRGQTLEDPADLKLTGAAGRVLEKSLRRSDPVALRATGVAYLLIGRQHESVAALERAAAASNDATACNDLAAARLALAQLPQALADTDRALRIDPDFPEALFNRALILERLGRREEARAAWQRYLTVEPAGGWSQEARTHLRR